MWMDSILITWARLQPATPFFRHAPSWRDAHAGEIRYSSRGAARGSGGRSNIVGKPMALMLLQKSATVTICTSKTRDLAEHTRRADILVVAAGKPRMISAAMIKAGAAVIDVGINRLPDGSLTGDELRFRQGESRIHYPCSGRGRADDNYHVTLQHHRGRGTRSNTVLAAALQANGRPRHVYNIPRI